MKTLLFSTAFALALCCGCSPETQKAVDDAAKASAEAGKVAAENAKDAAVEAGKKIDEKTREGAKQIEKKADEIKAEQEAKRQEKPAN